MGLMLLADRRESGQEQQFVIGPRQDDPLETARRARLRELWHRAYLLGRELADPHYQTPTLAAAAFVAARATLPSLEGELVESQRMVTTIRGISGEDLDELCWRLSETEPEIRDWAEVLVDWLGLQSAMAGSRLSVEHHGWALATFGRGYWVGAAVSYLSEGKERRLVFPFSPADALEFLGGFTCPEREPPRGPTSRLTLADISATRGLESPRLWRWEGFFGAIPGVVRTELGHTHRQYLSSEHPEWLETLVVQFDPHEVGCEEILTCFWAELLERSGLSFSQLALLYADERQRDEAFAAWTGWRDPDCARLPLELVAHQATWFDAAEAARHKSVLRSVRVLEQAFRKSNLVQSSLAAKVNGFAAGYGRDQDVVVEAARFGLDEESTRTLRLIRYLASQAAVGAE